MKTRNQNGAIQPAVLVALLTTLLFFVSLIMALVFFMGKNDLQKNLDAKVEERVAEESEVIAAKKDAELAEKEKSPTKSYTGPSTAGSVSFAYPKTYSGYVVEGTSGSLVDGFFQQNIVPRDDGKVKFALRLEISSRAYETEMKSFDSLIKSGKARASAFKAASVPSVLGTRIDGELGSGKQGIMIVLPIRDKTLRIWSESPESLKDFETFVIPSLNFVP